MVLLHGKRSYLRAAITVETGTRPYLEPGALTYRGAGVESPSLGGCQPPGPLRRPQAYHFQPGSTPPEWIAGRQQFPGRHPIAPTRS